MTVGERIRARREELGLTQKELSEITGLEQVTVRVYERDSDHINLSIITIEKIASALNISPAILVGWDKPDKNRLRQIESFVCKQKALILTSQSESQRIPLIAMWHGFITGLKMTKAIDFKEHAELDAEIKDFTRRLNEDEKKTSSNIGSITFTTKVASSC